MRQSAKTKKELIKERSRPALTPESRENQMISLAIDVAEQQLRDGTASSQVITHFLKLGSTKERLEQDLIREKKALIKAKVDAIKAAERIEQLYSSAITAMRSYRSSDGEDERE